MKPRSLKYRLERIKKLELADSRRHSYRQHGQSCRKVVGNIIQLGGSPSELQITLIFIPEHGVERVDGFIRYCANRTEQQRVEQRRSHTVNGVFGHTFCCGESYAAFVERGCIAPYHQGDFLTCQLTVACFKSGLNSCGMIAQVPESKRAVEQVNAQGETGNPVQLA